MAAVGHQNDFLLLMTLARCLNASGLGLLFSASTDLLYQLTHPKDTKTAENSDGSQEVEVHHKVQKTLTNIATLSTLLDFFLAPMIGSFMDSVGRLPTMMLAMGCSSLVRFCLAVSPSLKLYMFYRALVSITGNAWLSASSAALGDVFGRGTARFAEASSRVQRFALLAMMLGTFAGRWVKEPQKAFALVGTLQVMAAGAVGCMKESLMSQSKFQRVWFWSVFRRSKALFALAVLSTAMELPDHVATLDQVFRRQKFPKLWTASMESTHMLLLQIAGVFHTFLRARILKHLDSASACRLDNWCNALCFLNNAFSTRPSLLALNPLLSCFQCGGLSLELCLRRQAESVGLGSGALSAADANRSFLPSLWMPRFYSWLYHWSPWPSAPYLVASGMSLLAAEVVGPWTFARL